MKARIILLASTALTTWLLVAVPAVASDNGEGLVGETTDKIITFFSLGVVVFFALLVTLLSWLQSTLDKRKEQRKGAKVKDVVGW
jgi:hypothetical protein